MIHPARQMPFDELYDGLQAAVRDGYVSSLTEDALTIYSYNQRCVYEKAWTPITLIARGLILDRIERRIVATPFPKFFNVGEHEHVKIPDLPFETLEKLDGSLIILFWHGGQWRTATKGSFWSDQAFWAKVWLDKQDTSLLDPGTTYLCEAIYPQNRIVVRYEFSGLVLLSAYDNAGSELSYLEISTLASRLGWRMAKRFDYSRISDLLAKCKNLPAMSEGFVIWFQNGFRLKVKGEEYCRIHQMVSRVTPLAVWESMASEDDMGAIRKDLPEEFWSDFDRIVELIQQMVVGIVSLISNTASEVADLTDKQLGLCLNELPEISRRFIFAYRKSGGNLLTGRNREAIFRAIRPTRNELAGYEPSLAMNRIHDDI